MNKLKLILFIIFFVPNSNFGQIIFENELQYFNSKLKKDFIDNQNNLNENFITYERSNEFGKTDIKQDKKSRLDSVIIGDSKIEYKYDFIGREKSYTSYSNEGLEIEKKEYYYHNNIKEILEYRYYPFFRLSSKVEYIYDSIGNNVQLSNYSYAQSDPKLTNQKNYSYNSNGTIKNSIYIEYKWTIDNVKLIARKEEYSYNTDGKLLTEILYYLNELTNELDTLHKYVYIHDSSGNTISLYKYSWKASPDNRLSRIYKDDFYYDSLARMSVTIHSKVESDKLILTGKTKYDYNPDGTISQIVTLSWNTNSNVWGNSFKTLYTYGEFVIIDIYQGYQNEWWKLETEKSKYDFNGNRISYIYESHGESERWDFSFDLSTGQSDIILPSINELPDYQVIVGNNKLLKTIHTTRYGSIDKIFYYSDVESYPTPIQNAEQLIIYPNPAKTEVFINIYNENSLLVEIFDLNGKKISSQKIYENRILLENIMPGLYILRIYFDDEIYAKKIMITQ